MATNSPSPVPSPSTPGSAQGFTAALTRPMAATVPRINVAGFICRGTYEATAIAVFSSVSPMALFLASLGAEVDQLQRDAVRASRRLALSLAEYADDLVARLTSDGSCPMGDSTARDIAEIAVRLRTKRSDFYALAASIAEQAANGNPITAADFCRNAHRLPTIIGRAVVDGVDLSTPSLFEMFLMAEVDGELGGLRPVAVSK